MDKPESKFLAVHYQLYQVVDGQKELVEQTSKDSPFEFVSGFGVSLDGFEEQVVNMEKGTEFDFTLEPAKAFGEYDPEGVHRLKRELFMVKGKFDTDHVFERAEIAMQDAEGRLFKAKVLKIDDESVTIDTNPPLAGKTLNFTGEVLENREPTLEEIQRVLKLLSGEGCEGCGGGCSEGGGCGHCH